MILKAEGDRFSVSRILDAHDMSVQMLMKEGRHVGPASATENKGITLTPGTYKLVISRLVIERVPMHNTYRRPV